MHITRDMSARTFSLDHSKYARDIMATHGMTGYKPSQPPKDPASCPASRMDSPPLTGAAKNIYPSLLGNIQCAVSCMHAPWCIYGFTHPWLCSGAPHGGSPLGTEEGGALRSWDNSTTHDREGGAAHSLHLIGVADTDWANDISTRKSRSGDLLTLGRGYISCKTKQWTCVA
jgi:hypothetical protein